jgi:hypothetical protein
MMMSVEQRVEWLERETVVLGGNLAQCRFVHHKSHMTWPGIEFGVERWKACDQPPRLRHGLSTCVETHAFIGLIISGTGSKDVSAKRHEFLNYKT